MRPRSTTRISLSAFALPVVLLACGGETVRTGTSGPSNANAGAAGSAGGSGGRGPGPSGASGTAGDSAAAPPGGGPCDDHGGGTCGPTEYCSYMEADACGTGGKCVPRPGGCLAIGDPSMPCMCDGARSYDACTAALFRGISRAPFAARCSPDGALVPCNDFGRGLVCGTREYCDKSGAASCFDDGVCRPLPQDCEAEVNAPVCGCDGKMHANACKAHLAGASVSPQDSVCRTPGPGTCSPTEPCPSGQYCDYEGTLGCGGVGLCQPLPTDCLDTCEPSSVRLCGCDGGVYCTLCKMHRKGVSASPDPTRCGDLPP